MELKEEIYQRYLQKRGDCQKYKDVIDYFLYLRQDEQITEFSPDALQLLNSTIEALQELINSNQNLTIDKKYLEMAIEEGKKILEKTV